MLVHMYVCAYRHMSGVPEGQKRPSDLVELELVIVVSCYVGVEN